MSIKLPPNKQWVQGNRSDVLINTFYEQNNLWATFNCDCNMNKSRIRITRLFQTSVSTDDTAMTDIPVAFKAYGGASIRGTYCVAGSFVHFGSSTTSNFQKYTSISGYPTNCSALSSDLEIFNGYLYVTTASTNVYYFSGSAWSSFTTVADSGKKILRRYGNRLYCLLDSSQKIISWDTSNTVSSSTTSQFCYGHMTAGIGKESFFMEPSEDRIWIGIGTNGGYGNIYQKGEIHEWDGSSNQATVIHKLDSGAPMACVIKDNIPWIVDSNGRLLKYNGSSFVEVARLPIDDKLLYTPYSQGTTFIHNNGISVINGKINMLINGAVLDSSVSSQERCPSGIWEYDEKVGLYHKYSISQTANNLGTQYDWGASRVYGVGALYEDKIQNSGSNATGHFLVGASIYSNATSNNYGIWTNDTYWDMSGTYIPSQKAGYFITSKIESQQITDTWQSVYIKYRKFLSSSDKIVVKYRNNEVYPLDNVTITWVNTTSFTVTTSTISGWTVGDEVEILNGTGAGLCAHIVSSVDSSGTSTVTIDETATGVTTGTAIARFQHWIKLGYIADQTSNWKNLTHGTSVTSTWVQYKVYMMFSNPKGEVEELDVRSTTSQSIN